MFDSHQKIQIDRHKNAAAHSLSPTTRTQCPIAANVATSFTTSMQNGLHSKAKTLVSAPPLCSCRAADVDSRFLPSVRSDSRSGSPNKRVPFTLFKPSPVVFPPFQVTGREPLIPDRPGIFSNPASPVGSSGRLAASPSPRCRRQRRFFFLLLVGSLLRLVSSELFKISRQNHQSVGAHQSRRGFPLLMMWHSRGDDVCRRFDAVR